MSLKLGWCITGHCPDCPEKVGDPEIVCTCPHHKEESEKTDG